MIPDWITGDFLDAQCARAARTLQAAAPAMFPDEGAAAGCLRECFSLGAGTDDLRQVHPAVLWRVSRSYPGAPEPLLFAAVLLAAEGFQAAHAGSAHIHAVGAVAASACKLPYVRLFQNGAPGDVSFLISEMYRGVPSLVLRVLTREGTALFAGDASQERRLSYLRERLASLHPPEDPMILPALCAGAGLMASFHHGEAVRYRFGGNAAQDP